LIKTDPNRKYGQNAYKGPYRIIRVNDNGTLRYQNGTEEFKILLISGCINVVWCQSIRRFLSERGTTILSLQNTTLCRLLPPRTSFRI